MTVVLKTQSPRTLRTVRPDSLADRKGTYMANMLTHFKNLVELAATPAGDGDSKEVAAAHALQMEVESTALVLPLLWLGQPMLMVSFK
jgi:hypothetical protein